LTTVQAIKPILNETLIAGVHYGVVAGEIRM